MHDVVVVGGGPVGLSAAVATASLGLEVAVIEAGAEAAARGARVFALSHGARLILERLGVWPAIADAAPIRAVQVSQRGRLGHTVLRAEELALPALGYAVEESGLVRALAARASALRVDLVSQARVQALEASGAEACVRYERAGRVEERTAQVIAQADGGASGAAEERIVAHDYGQCAVTAPLECERALRDWAYERFTGRGPIALLPFAGRHALIWSLPRAAAESMLVMDAPGFAQALRESYGERLGEVRLAGEVAAFPLQLRFAHRIAGERHVRIGNAAQTLHPVAGQGFNIGLRDAFELARALADARAHGRDLLAGVRAYGAGRRLDRIGGTLFTDFLVRVFSNDDPVIAAARSAGLLLLDAAPPAKRFLMRRMIFGARA